MDSSHDLDLIPKARLSIVEAVNQLDIAKSAFKQSEKIQGLLETHSREMDSIRTSMSSFVTSAYLSSKLDDFSQAVQSMLKSKFESFSTVYCNQLDNKVSNEQLDSQLQKKVGWAQYSSLSQQVALLQSRVDKHIYSEFEGFKTKMKLELANKANDSKNFDVNNEEFVQMKNKIVQIEQKLDEMFMEDDNNIDDEYDSQEEMDNMMEDIDIVAKREESNSGEIEAEQSTNAEFEISTVEKSEASLKVETGHIEHFVEDKKTESPKFRELEKPMSRNSRARGSSIGGGSGAMQRRGSKESSVAASRALGGGGLKQINRKITALQKDIESNRAEIDEGKKYTKSIEDALSLSKSYAESLETKITEINSTLSVMEASFIRALRRNGLDKKQKKPEIITSGLSKKDLDNIDKKFEDKFRRILKLEIDVEKVTSDSVQTRKKLTEKINEIIASLKYLEEFKLKAEKELQNLYKVTEKQFEFNKSEISEFSRRVNNLNEPLIDLISDQQRENQVLHEEVRRQQELFRAMVEDYSGNRNRSQSENREIIEFANVVKRKHAKRNSETPDLTVKNKFYQTGVLGKASPRKVESHWTKKMPDGKAISLPRVTAKEQLGKRIPGFKDTA